MAAPEGQPRPITYDLTEALRGATPLEGKVLHNFYLTYMFSQGSAPLQRRLMYGAKDYYNASGFVREFGTTASINHVIRPRLASLRLPFFHTDVDGKGMALTEYGSLLSNFETEWKIQGEALGYIPGIRSNYQFQASLFDGEVFGGGLATKNKEELLLEIATGMVRRDIYFLIKGRKNRKDNPYESFVKTYVIDGEPTMSDEFDKLFRDTYKIIQKAMVGGASDGYEEEYGVLTDYLNQLKEKWEARHESEPWENY